MAQGDGSSVLTESGRTPLAVLLGDTGEIERELDEALGRLTESASPESSVESSVDADRARRFRSGLFEPPPPPRLHASVIGGRIQSLAEEAYSQELQRRREEDPSGRHPVLPGAPAAPARVRTLEEDALANLPWELRRYLVPSQEPRDRPFVYGAAVGALIAVLAAGATFTGILLLQPQLLGAAGGSAPVAQPVSAQAPATSLASAAVAPEGSPLATGSSAQVGSPSVVTSAAPEAAAAGPQTPPAPAQPTLNALPPSVTVATAISQVELTGRAQATPRVPAPPATQAAGGETLARLEQRARAPRVVPEPPLAAKVASEEEVAFVGEEEGTAPAEVATSAALNEDTTPPPTAQELDDAFERQFGVASPAHAAAAEQRRVRASVFVPAPVAQLPETLGNGEVMAVVVSHKEQVAGCVNAHAAKSEERRTLVLSWVIAPEGGVENVRIESPGHQTSPLGACVRDAVAGWRFGRHLQAQPVRFPFAY